MKESKPAANARHEVGVRGGHGAGAARTALRSSTVTAFSLSGRSGMTRSLALTLKLHTCFSSILYFPKITVSPSRYAELDKAWWKYKKEL